MRTEFLGELVWVVPLFALAFVAQHVFAQDASPFLHNDAPWRVENFQAKEASRPEVVILGAGILDMPERVKMTADLMREDSDRFLFGSVTSSPWPLSKKKVRAGLAENGAPVA